MLCRRYRDRISLVEFINCVMASGARLPVQIEKKSTPLSPSLSLSLSFPFLNLPPSLSSVLILLVRVQEGRESLSSPFLLRIL